MHDYLDQNQILAVHALEKLKAICDKHGIQFFLLAGTALGAVRHKGMIPWDDDIDVGFCRKEFDQIRSILTEELGDGYEYLDQQVNPDFPRLFGKIVYQGQPCVDLFLIAKWNTGLMGKIQFRVHKIAVDMFKFSMNYRTPIRPNLPWGRRLKIKTILAIEQVIYNVLRWKYTTEDFVKLARWNETYFERHKANCYIDLYSVYSMQKELIWNEWIENTSIVEFEGNMYTALGDTHAYLTKLYGDYMTPPSENKRKKIHNETFSIG